MNFSKPPGGRVSGHSGPGTLKVLSMAPDDFIRDDSASPRLDAAVKAKCAVRNLEELAERCRESGGPQLVEGLLPHLSLTIALGDSGIGKSPLCYLLAVSVAAGIRFLGREVTQGRVLYLDYENGLQQVRDMARRIGGHLGIDAGSLEDQFLLWNFNDLPTDWTSKDIFDVIREVNPALVVIDSLASCSPEAESRNYLSVRFLQACRGAMRDTGCSIVIVHHLRKASANPKERPEPLETTTALREWFLQARGGSALINATDVRLGLAVRMQKVRMHTGQDKIADDPGLILRGFARITGEIPRILLERVYDDDHIPLGYREMRGAELLPEEQRKKYDELPDRFRHKVAKQVYGKGDQATTGWLQKCIGYGLLKHQGIYYEKRGATE
jgi:AAA domain-containing protein